MGMGGMIGRRAARGVLGRYARPGGPLDVRFGFALLKDRRVPVASKLTALALGLILTLLLGALEIPWETLLAALVPFGGLAGDLVVDGLELVLGPPVIAALLMPRLVPRVLAEVLRRERQSQPSA